MSKAREDEVLPYLDGLNDDNRNALVEALTSLIEDKDSDLRPTQIRDIEPVDVWLKSRYYNSMARNLFDYWVEEIADFIENGYNEWVITGSIGTGKSTAALVTADRKLYELSCWDVPQRLFRLADMTKIFFAYLSVNLKQAELTGFGQFREMIDQTPYFQEEYKRQPKVDSILKFPSEVFVIPGSDALSFIGTNLFGVILDEINFLRQGGQGATGNVAKAQTIYQEATDRRRSRFMFQGKDPGFSLLVSSSTVQTSFTASRIQAAEKEKARTGQSTTKVTNTKLWEVKPKGTYSERVFYVFNGSEREDPFLIEQPKDVLELIDDPVDTKRVHSAIRPALEAAYPEVFSPHPIPPKNHGQDLLTSPDPFSPTEEDLGTPTRGEDDSSLLNSGGNHLPKDVDLYPEKGNAFVALREDTGRDGWVYGPASWERKDPVLTAPAIEAGVTHRDIKPDNVLLDAGALEWGAPDRGDPGGGLRRSTGLLGVPGATSEGGSDASSPGQGALPQGSDQSPKRTERWQGVVFGGELGEWDATDSEACELPWLREEEPSSNGHCLQKETSPFGYTKRSEVSPNGDSVQDKTLPNSPISQTLEPKPPESGQFGGGGVSPFGDSALGKDRLELPVDPQGGCPWMDHLWPALPVDVRNVVSRIPVDFRKSFDGDLFTALKNIAGVSIAPMGKLFSSRAVWRRALREEIPNPFTKETISISLNGPEQVLDYFRADLLFDSEGQMRRHPYSPRYLRVDQSKNYDDTGIACVHRAGWDTSTGLRLPVVECDFVMRIKPPPKPDRIAFYKLRAFILALRDMGMKIGGVTFDQYQSEDHMQLLTLEGLKASYLSVDKTDGAYLMVVNLLNEGRLRMHPYAPLRDEFFNLDWDRVKGKVDHPMVNPDGSRGSKDVADAFTGAVFECVNGINTSIPVRREFLDGIRAVGPTMQERYEGALNFDWVLPEEYRGKVELEPVLAGSSIRRDPEFDPE